MSVKKKVDRYVFSVSFVLPDTHTYTHMFIRNAFMDYFDLNVLTCIVIKASYRWGERDLQFKGTLKFSVKKIALLKANERVWRPIIFRQADWWLFQYNILRLFAVKKCKILLNSSKCPKNCQEWEPH